MPGIEIARAVYDGFAGTLEQRVADFAVALEAHRTSVGLPAPVEAPLVEAIARAGGMAEVTIVDPPAPPTPSTTSRTRARRCSSSWRPTRATGADAPIGLRLASPPRR